MTQSFRVNKLYCEYWDQLLLYWDQLLQIDMYWDLICGDILVITEHRLQAKQGRCSVFLHRPAILHNPTPSQTLVCHPGWYSSSSRQWALTLINTAALVINIITEESVCTGTACQSTTQFPSVQPNCSIRPTKRYDLPRYSNKEHPARSKHARKVVNGMPIHRFLPVIIQ